MRVLVTGGAGFIGRGVVDCMTAAGHDVSVLDLASTGAPEEHHGDIGDPGTCDVALRGVEVVVHLAAKVGLGVDLQDMPAYAASNDLGTAVLLAAMARARTRRLVLASSMVVYGEGAYTCRRHGPVTPGPRGAHDLAEGRFEPPCPACGGALQPGLVGEDARLDPRSTYAATKVAQEHLSAAWARGSGGGGIALRLHNVYGPGMPRDTPYAGVAAIFSTALAAGRAPRVFEDGGQRRDFVHVRDIAAAVSSAAASVEPTGTLRPYNVGSGTVRTVLDLATALANVHGGLPPVVTGDYRLGDVRHITASSERIAAELGWRAETTLEEGMAEFARA